jgi:hypothetical protein
MMLQKTIHCIIFLLACNQVIFSQINPCDRTVSNVPYSSIKYDTTIVLKNGTLLTFNRCEYFDVKDCLEIKEALSVEEITNQNFSTLDDKGNFLLTGGMLNITMPKDCNEKICFDVPVKIRMPIRVQNCEGCKRNGLRLYVANGNYWVDSNSKELKIIDINGNKYGEFELTCANTGYNFDCKMYTTKVKFKAKHIAQFNKLTILSTCPVGVAHYYPNGTKKVKAKLPCFNADSVKIIATGVDANGNVVKYEKYLSQLKHGKLMKNCKKKYDSFLSRLIALLGTRKGILYKKYLID